MVKSHNVLPEIDLVIPFPVFRQREERFNAFFCGVLVDGGEHASVAGFYTGKPVASNGEPIPGIFLERRSTDEYEVGPEAIHRQPFSQPGVEIVE